MRYLLLTVFLLAGCESVPRGELVYMGVHTIDIAQTYNSIPSSPCYAEGDPITRRVNGRHPSKGQVVLWGLAVGTAHYGISTLLEDHAPGWALAAWQTVSIGAAGITITNNHELGMRPWGDSDPSQLENPDCEP